jgi:glycosyltransferase involved in cell wall biosynthesis
MEAITKKEDSHACFSNSLLMTDRIPETPPLIAPLESDESRPVWSVMIPTYNCINYLVETIQCVLAQDPGPDMMQIEVIDDFSTDGDVGALVKEIGKGRVGFFKQEVNRGSLRNFETCLNRARGKWIHLLHGDDRVKPGFYNEIETLLNKYPEAGAAFTKYTHIDENGTELPPGKDELLSEPGIIKDFLIKIAQFQRLQPPSIVVKRSVYEKLGGFFAVHYGEDWEMWARIAAHYPIAYSPALLAQYRVGHTANITSRSLLTGQNIRDINSVIDIIATYLPASNRNKLRLRAKKNFSVHYAIASFRLYKSDKNIAFVQARGALNLNINLRTVYWIGKLYLRHLKYMLTPKTKGLKNKSYQQVF